jgi:peptidoglycan/xylan/chitin deacetylase (PgdA/CDA1 family)
MSTRNATAVAKPPTAAGITDPGATRRLAVVAYHYVRDLPRTRFPRIKGLALDVFRRQLDEFQQRYEMTSLTVAVEFLAGRYLPRRDLCLLTFDDGLKEHYTEVLPLLRERGLSACFFPATSCVEGQVACVHMIHFLMAACDLADLQRDLSDALPASCADTALAVSAAEVARCYPWDTSDVGTFKYLLNFALPTDVREAAVSRLFHKHLGSSEAFARELYMSWNELREMQGHGMVIGGHSHAHRALSSLSLEAQVADLTRGAELMASRLRPQDAWPFAYPYGWHNDTTVSVLRDLNYACAFTVETGANDVNQDAFRLRRFDTVQLLPV